MKRETVVAKLDYMIEYHLEWLLIPIGALVLLGSLLIPMNDEQVAPTTSIFPLPTTSLVWDIPTASQSPDTTMPGG
jgi:hypothetical protein